ncbi:MAG: SGNH/GDSL hydrolase family protein, partial [Myxococcota bacterium]
QRLASEARARQPHLILIYAGFNDSRRLDAPDGPNATPVDAFADLLHEVLSAARAVAPTVIMTGYPFDESRTQPYPGTNAFYRLEDARRYNHALTGVADSLEVKVIDFFGHFRDADMTPLLAADGLHGNAECHQRLFELTRQFLENEYGAPP